MGRMEGLTVTDCEKCPALVESRGRIVNGVGPADADLLFVGEAPGREEDEEGEPFVGQSGRVLHEKLRERGLDRDAVRITNCVRCRPPENRTPRNEELANCRGYLETEIEAIDPALIVTLGKVPSEHLLERDVAVTSEGGSIVEHEIAGTRRRVLICVHPAATLYDASQEGTLDRALDAAVETVGATDGGQSSLDEF